MVVSISTQISLIIYSLLAGILTGVLFDIYRFIRGYENPNRLITFIEDILFWIFAGVTVFIFLLYNNFKYMGAYVYLYIAFGIYIYLCVLSKKFLAFQSKIIKVLSKFFRITKNIIIYPFELIAYKLRKK